MTQHLQSVEVGNHLALVTSMNHCSIFIKSLHINYKGKVLEYFSVEGFSKINSAIRSTVSITDQSLSEEAKKKKMQAYLSIFMFFIPRSLYVDYSPSVTLV